MTSSRESGADLLAEEFLSEVVARFADDRRVRRNLPGGGKLHLDRRLPFLCVYRKPTDREDPGTWQLITGEASYLAVADQAALRRPASELVRRLASAAVSHFGAFLIVEVWSSQDSDLPPRLDPETQELVLPQPYFRIHGTVSEADDQTIVRLRAALERVKVFRQWAEVVTDAHAHPHPTDLPPLLTTEEARDLRCHVLGLEVRPIYRDSENGSIFPAPHRVLRRRLGRALKQAFFTFSRTHTSLSASHYSALGRRTVAKAVWDVDRQLAQVSDSFDFLLQVTPINSETAWYQFKEHRYRTPPVFDYRPLAAEPALLKRRLFDVPIENIEDPTLAHLFREKQDELDRKITMLCDVGTWRFLAGSLQVYGRVEPPLLNLANEMLRRAAADESEEDGGLPLDAHGFADRALAEMDFYRGLCPEFRACVTVRDDIYSGLMVSQGNLLIGRETVIPSSRADALVQHEIGTHCLTFHNAVSQPFRLLHSGLAGYESLQEGLAVLAEYLVGGLSRPRLRLLAARVVAAHHLVEGATFPETYKLLHDTFHFSQRTAFTNTTRVYRGGGLTKDAIYLRGLVDVLGYLGRGGSLEPLWVGKLALEHVPIVEELLHRHVLLAAPLRPRYMDNPQAPDKLARLAQGLSVLDLLEGS